MMFFEKFDDVQFMLKFICEFKRKIGKFLFLEFLKYFIDVDNEFWWWCDIIYSKVKLYDNFCQKGWDFCDY